MSIGRPLGGQGATLAGGAGLRWRMPGPQFAKTKSPIRGTRRIWDTIAVTAAAAVPLVMFAAFTLWLQRAALNFHIADPLADYVTGLAWGGALLVCLAVAPIPAAHKGPLLLLWTVHVGIALGAMLAYESYYGLDVIGYFNTGITLTDPFATLAFGQGTQNIAGLVGIVSALVGGSYHALKIVWGFAGLIAVYVFYLAARLYLGRDDIRVLYILGLFPSIAFWSTILGKDPLTLLGLALFSLGVVGVLRRGGAKYLVLFGSGLLMAASIRVWLGAIFLAPFVSTTILSSRSGPLRKIVLLILIVPAFLFAVQAFGNQFSIESTDDLVTRTDDLAQSWASGGSGQVIQGGFTSIESMVAFLPLGIVTALFRPLPGEVLSPFGILAGLENALVIVLLAGALRRHPIRRLRDPVLLWMALTILAWASIYGFVSYQNLGSAFRFKLQVMPLLLLLLLALRAPLIVANPEAAPARRNATDGRSLAWR